MSDAQDAAPAPHAPTPTAAELKAEGNALFVKKEFLAASYKFTAGIEEDASSAILYANRAACYMGLKRYVDAISDATKATELDPKYAKAWSRLAAAHDALNAPYNSISAWESAIAALPADDTKTRAQYNASLRAAEAAKRRMEIKPAKVHIMPAAMKQETPWLRAQKMRASGQLPIISSGWVIFAAYEEFKEGVETMNQLKKIQTPQGLMLHGKPDALDALSNAILRDSRIFHITQPDFVSKYNTQAQFEAQRFDAWIHGGPETILENAKQRLAMKGWDAARPALATSVRGFIMRGFLEDGLRQNHAAGVEYIGNALTIIESGRRTWSNVPKSRRGAIFEWTFWAGVKALFLEIFQHAYSSSPGLDSPYPLETLLEHAEELLKNKGPGPSGEIDPGFLLSFTVYPRSKAFAMKGYYHNQMARIGHGGSADAIVDHLKKAAKYYVKAADCLPPDDESHAWFIWCALEAFWRHGAPLKTTLPLMARIREAIPLFKPIWEHSSSAEGHKALQTALWFEEDMRKGLQEGKFTEDNPIVPEPFSRFEKGW